MYANVEPLYEVLVQQTNAGTKDLVQKHWGRANMTTSL